MSIVPAWLAQKATAAEEKLKANSKPAKPKKAEVIQLPTWHDIERAIPNHLARSSLFAPIARGRRKVHQGSLLVSRSDATIEFWGEQLDEAQADVWMQAIHEARLFPLGQAIIINRAAFLRSIGRDTGKWQYDWLHRTMKALAFAMLVIETRKNGQTKMQLGRSKSLHLIDGFEFDPEAETYTLRIDPQWLAMFNNNEFSLIDWSKRFQIENRVDLAKRLQRLVATSSDKVQRYSLEYLKEVCCHEGRMRDFKTALVDAMSELERLHIIRNPIIEISTQGNEQACWQRIKG